MWTVFFAVLAGYCAFKWLNQYVCSAALLLWALGKEYTPPSEEEMKACLLEVWKRTLHLK